MHSRICLAAIIVMLLGAASSSDHSRFINFWYEELNTNKWKYKEQLKIHSNWKSFEKKLDAWLIRGETDLGLPKSTLTTLDALSAFLFEEDHKEYYSLVFYPEKKFWDCSEHYFEFNANKVIEMVNKDLIPIENRLQDKVKEYLNLRETAKEKRREAKLAERNVNGNTEPGFFLKAEESKRAAEDARLQAIEEQKDLGRVYHCLHQMDEYEATVLLNTSLLAFMTMLEQKMQDEKAFGALRLVPSLTDAFKLEVLSKEILSTIPKIEIIDWLEEKIEKDIFGVNQKSLPGSTTGKQSPLSVAELASGKTEDLRNYVFTITLLENLPVLFEMAHEKVNKHKMAHKKTIEIKMAHEKANKNKMPLENANKNKMAHEKTIEIKMALENVNNNKMVHEKASKNIMAQKKTFTREANELFITKIKGLLIANDDPKSTEWSTTMHKLIGIPPALVRTPRSKPGSPATALDTSRLNDIDTQIKNLRDEINICQILARVSQNLFTHTFKVDLIREKLREMNLLVATMRVLGRQDVADIIEKATNKNPNDNIYNRRINPATPIDELLIKEIFIKLRDRFDRNVDIIHYYGRKFYLNHLFPEKKSDAIEKYLELSDSKLLSTVDEQNDQMLRVMNEMASLAGKYFSKSSTLERISRFYDEAFLLIKDKKDLLLGRENEAFDLIQNYFKHQYRFKASKNLKKIVEARFSKILKLIDDNKHSKSPNEISKLLNGEDLVNLYDAFQFFSRRTAASKNDELTIFLDEEKVPYVVESAKRFLSDTYLGELRKQTDKSRLFETNLLSFEANRDLFDELYDSTLLVSRWLGIPSDGLDRLKWFNLELDIGLKEKNYLLFKLLVFIIFKPEEKFEIKDMYDPLIRDNTVKQTVKILEKNAESLFMKIVKRIHEKMMDIKPNVPAGENENLSVLVKEFFGKELKSDWLEDIEEMKSVEPIPRQKRTLYWELLKI